MFGLCWCYFLVVVGLIVEDIMRFYIEFSCVDYEITIEYCSWMCFLGRQLAKELTPTVRNICGVIFFIINGSLV